MIEGYTLPRNAEMENVFYRHSDHRSMIQNPLQTQSMRHSVLDTESPAHFTNASFRATTRNPLQVLWALKLFSSLQSVQLCDSETSSE